MFSKKTKKKVHVDKPDPKMEQFLVFLDAVKMENYVKVSSIMQMFSKKLVNMHDHVSSQ